MENLPVEITPETKKLMDAPITMVEYANDLSVNDGGTYAKAGETLRRLKTKQKELDSTRKDITQPMEQAKKKIIELFKGPLGMIADAEAIIKRKMLAYDAEIERKRREVEAKEQEKARKKQEKLEARAELAREQGKEEKADDLEMQADEVSIPVVAAVQPKSEGTHTTTTWSAEVTDKMALIKAVAEGRAPEAMLDVNMPTANKMAKALKEEMKFDGLKAVAKKSLSARAF